MSNPRSVATPAPSSGSDPSIEWVVTETLDRISGMQRFNAWLFEEILPYLGRRVLEVGSGIGNFSEFFVSRVNMGGDLVVLSDISQEYVELLRERYADRPGILVERYPMEDPPTERLKPLGIDTVVALNVLEHVEDDGAALRKAAGILVPGGRLVVLVPAGPGLYCDFDRLLGHHRRYRKAELAEAVRAAGLEPRICRHFNLVGALGWLFSGKIARRKVLPRGQLRLYDTMVPLLRRIERWIGPPFGLSILLIARKGKS